MQVACRFPVMPGLEPGSHAGAMQDGHLPARAPHVDGWDKPGHDGRGAYAAFFSAIFTSRSKISRVPSSRSAGLSKSRRKAMRMSGRTLA